MPQGVTPPGGCCPPPRRVPPWGRALDGGQPGTCLDHAPAGSLVGDERGGGAAAVGGEGVGAAARAPQEPGEEEEGDDEEEGEEEQRGRPHLAERRQPLAAPLRPRRPRRGGAGTWHRPLVRGTGSCQRAPGAAAEFHTV